MLSDDKEEDLRVVQPNKLPDRPTAAETKSWRDWTQTRRRSGELLHCRTTSARYSWRHARR